MNRSKGYYRFRSVVRWIFWSSVVVLLEWLFIQSVVWYWSVTGLGVS